MKGARMSRKTSSIDLTPHAEPVNPRRVRDDLFDDEKEVADALKATKESIQRETGRKSQ
jgi:hypothetical protein